MTWKRRYFEKRESRVFESAIAERDRDRQMFRIISVGVTRGADPDAIVQPFDDPVWSPETRH